MVTTERCRVVVADDVAEVRELLSDALEIAGGYTVVGAAADGREAVELVGRLRPNVAVVDLFMPVMDGLEAIFHLRAVSLTTRIVVLSGFGTEAVRAQAIAAGADAFIDKVASIREIVGTIARVA